MKAAWKAYEERMLPILKEEKPGLKMSQVRPGGRRAGPDSGMAAVDGSGLAPTGTMLGLVGDDAVG
jgi:hypothetical protein